MAVRGGNRKTTSYFFSDIIKYMLSFGVTVPKDSLGYGMNLTLLTLPSFPGVTTKLVTLSILLKTPCQEVPGPPAPLLLGALLGLQVTSLRPHCCSSSLFPLHCHLHLHDFTGVQIWHVICCRAHSTLGSRFLTSVLLPLSLEGGW